MKPHGNSHDNMDEHHLYEILDKQENDIFKYGVSGDPLKEDGTSPRAEKQIRFLNKAVGWLRYFGEVLLTGIKGRKTAEDIENQYIEEYRKKHGRKPRGNS